MRVNCFAVNFIKTNCYVAHNEGEAVIVDPGGVSNDLLDFLAKENLKVVAVINTHGHADHISGNAWIMEETKAPLAIHQLDASFLNDPGLHLGPKIRQEVVPVEVSRLLGDGDLIKVGQFSLEVLHTPGHTPGGISLYTPGILLSGDTLFKSSVGRWDFPGSDEGALRESLRRLAKLPPETQVYPGHGPSTTIGEELKSNPFLISL
ncbi:MAG: MBL fold metallo-hydrolase [Firmicutes bacterium]|nr:MBL fold metallo-hydrolase [Bacillota bacterium]